MAVVNDIIDASDMIDTATSLRKARIAIVTGVTGTDAEREFDALNTGGVPAIGDALGASGALLNCKVISRAASPVQGQPNTIQVRLEYSTEQSALADLTDDTVPLFESDAIVQQTQTNTDRTGNLISLTYGSKTTGAFVSVLKPETTQTMRRIETGINPNDLQTAYVGKVNFSNFMNTGGFALSSDAGEWLCVGIRCRGTDAGTTWFVTYEFAKRAGGWDPVAVYIDPATGRPPHDLVLNTGFKTVTQYEGADFNALHLV